MLKTVLGSISRMCTCTRAVEGWDVIGAQYECYACSEAVSLLWHSPARWLSRPRCKRWAAARCALIL